MPQLLSLRATREATHHSKDAAQPKEKQTRLSMLAYIYVSAWAALTKYHRLGPCLNHRFISHSSGGWKWQTQVLARQVAFRGLLCFVAGLPSLDLSFMDSWDREWDGAGRGREREPKCGCWSLPLLRSLIAAWGPTLMT